MAANAYRSTVFGYTLSRVAIVLVALALCIYFLATNERGAFIVCALILAVLALFNVGVRVDGDSLRVSVLGLPIKTVSGGSVTGVEILQSAPWQEAQTFGVHFLDGALSIHAGPANVLVHREAEKSLRFTVDDPAACARTLERQIVGVAA